MSDWLMRKSFVMHSGDRSQWKIECDALTEEEIETFAPLISKKFVFGKVEGIPRGGLPVANALQKYCTRGPCLLVDGVLTTGASMELARKYHSDIGVVLFARGPCPEWIHPVFRLWAQG
ncbi:MAG: hypothetical protein WBG11_13150 [Methylocella sp.]